MLAADESGLDESKRLRLYGIKGWDIFTKNLVYVCYTNLFVLPTYHMLLYGVVKGFWNKAL